jgi:hypothetical protein
MNTTGLMLRSVAAPMRGDASRSMAARYVAAPPPASAGGRPFETHARIARWKTRVDALLSVRAPQGEGGTEAVRCRSDEVIE